MSSRHILCRRLCDRIAIIIDGRLVACGTLDMLLEETKAGDLEEAFFEYYKKHSQEAAG